MADDNKTADPQTADNPTVPEWVPEKFRSNPEKFAESYTELERRLTEESQHRAALEENYGELSGQLAQLQTAQQQTQGQGAADPLIAAYGSAIENGDYASALAIQAQVSQLAANAALEQRLPQVTQQVQQLGASQEQEIAAAARNGLAAQYGEAFTPEVESTMHDLLVANPNLYPDQARYDVNAARAAFDQVYKIATYGKQPAAAATVDASQMKQLAQTAQGAGGRALTPDEAKEEWDAIRSAKPKEYWQ